MQQLCFVCINAPEFVLFSVNTVLSTNLFIYVFNSTFVDKGSNFIALVIYFELFYCLLFSTSIAYA